MSPKYSLLEKQFDGGYWNDERMRNAVIMKWITPEEFFMITGQPYAPPEDAPAE